MIFLFGIDSLMADYLVEYNVDKITRPNISYDNPKPLIVEYHYAYNGDKTGIRVKIESNPQMFKVVREDGHVDITQSHVTYYDAVKRLDKVGFIIYKRTIAYETDCLIEEVRIYGVEGYNNIEPYGNTMLLTKEGNIIALAYIYNGDDADGEEDQELELRFYDLNKSEKKPFKIKKIKLSELDKSEYKIVSAPENY